MPKQVSTMRRYWNEEYSVKLVSDQHIDANFLLWFLIIQMDLCLCFLVSNTSKPTKLVINPKRLSRLSFECWIGSEKNINRREKWLEKNLIQRLRIILTSFCFGAEVVSLFSLDLGPGVAVGGVGVVNGGWGVRSSRAIGVSFGSFCVWSIEFRWWEDNTFPGLGWSCWTLPDSDNRSSLRSSSSVIFPCRFYKRKWWS